jgi:adenylate kinase family enzyme
MSSPELLLLGGPPWSGKTSIAKCAVRLERGEQYGHLSIGDFKRSIVSGERESMYKSQLQERTALYEHHAVVKSDAIIGIFEEYLEQCDEALTIVDGFPRYPDRLVPFRSTIKRMGATVIAFCEVKVEKAVILERSMQPRHGRDAPSLQEVEKRLADHNEAIIPTLNILARDYNYHPLDGSLPIEENAEKILNICESR